MKTNKKAISLIVLVITIIILAILAATVIISLSNTNIIEQANKAAFKSDMAAYKEAYNLYLTSKYAENPYFDASSITEADYDDIFGDSIKDAYRNKLQIVDGNLVYKTLDAGEKEIVKELGMAIEIKITPLSEVKVGDKVDYTPTANPTSYFDGATYETKDSQGYYIETVKKDYYTPGNMTWVYLGQDENGNILLTSQETTSFTMKITGQDGYATGPDRMNTLCNTLYGNSTYGTARNMKIEDVNRALGYTGPRGIYYDNDGKTVTTPEALTFGTIEEEFGTLSGINKPRLLPDKPFEDYLSDYYSYSGSTYAETKPDEYKLIFKKADGTTNQNVYWLSSPASLVYVNLGYAIFNVRYVESGHACVKDMFYSTGNERGGSYALRPVIVLKSNIRFGEKNLDGELTLVEM
ncbi:MAG: hypothetical protein IKV94_02350 [Clostridia bacterium]|nr:hypothetical protein [Clostridia bacterium]